MRSSTPKDQASVLVMAGGEKDMFSADFRIPTSEQPARKQDVKEDVEAEAVVAASSGAMPETFRDESPESHQKIAQESE